MDQSRGLVDKLIAINLRNRFIQMAEDSKAILQNHIGSRLMRSTTDDFFNLIASSRTRTPSSLVVSLRYRDVVTVPPCEGPLQGLPRGFLMDEIQASLFHTPSQVDRTQSDSSRKRTRGERRGRGS